MSAPLDGLGVCAECGEREEAENVRDSFAVLSRAVANLSPAEYKSARFLLDRIAFAEGLL